MMANGRIFLKKLETPIPENNLGVGVFYELVDVGVAGAGRYADGSAGQHKRAGEQGYWHGGGKFFDAQRGLGGTGCAAVCDRCGRWGLAQDWRFAVVWVFKWPDKCGDNLWRDGFYTKAWCSSGHHGHCYGAGVNGGSHRLAWPVWAGKNRIFCLATGGGGGAWAWRSPAAC